MMMMMMNGTAPPSDMAHDIGIMSDESSIDTGQQDDTVPMPLRIIDHYHCYCWSCSNAQRPVLQQVQLCAITLQTAVEVP